MKITEMIHQATDTKVFFLSAAIVIAVTNLTFGVVQVIKPVDPERFNRSNFVSCIGTNSSLEERIRCYETIYNQNSEHFTQQ